MSYLNKVWMAATVAVVQGHADQGCKWKAGLSSAHRVKRRLADLRPLSGSDLAIDGVADDERRRQASAAPDESLRQVMYLNCWGRV